MASNREGFTVRVLRSGSAAPAGVGFVVDERHIVTCAHVVNAALGRDPRAREEPAPTARVSVDFPMLGDPAGSPMRGCEVAAWVPPQEAGLSGGDLAGLALVGEGLPRDAGRARLVERPSRRDPAASVFGYPGDPPRQEHGAWVAVHVRGAVGGGLFQLDSDTESAIRAQPGYSGSPIVVQGDADDEVVGMLTAASRGGSGRDAYAMAVARLADAWPDVLGPLTVPECPYRGLEAFTADDAEAGVFVGREEEVGQLLEMLDRQALVMVTGPSGVGKSSLVNAGLVRAMHQEGWVTRVFQPGAMPFESLAEALFGIERAGPTPTVDELAERADRLRSGGLAALGSRLSLLKRQPIMLCVDQLEQLLDPGACAPAVSAGFLDLLLRAQPDARLRVICTLRADFLSQLLQHPDAGAYLRDRLFTLSPMGRERLERVITEPAGVRGVRYESGLPALIARDAGDGGGLPLLGFALAELWPQQRRRQITLTEYHGAGGVLGALNAYAERVFLELLERFPAGQIRRVMLALVRSRGGAAQATRRVVPRERLGPDWAVAEALAERRLVVVGHDLVKRQDHAEIAHEALIREWPRFAAWVDEDADFQHWITTLEERAAEGELLPDTRLAEADRWLAERPEHISDDVKRLIEDSRSEWSRRVTELEDARQRAERMAREAEARRLAATAEFALASRGVSLHVPIALAIEAFSMAFVFETDMAIRHAIRIAARPISRLNHDDAVHAVAFSPDGTHVATASHDGTARVFRAETGTEIARLNHDGPIRTVAFSPDGTRVATASDDGTIWVFQARTGTELSRHKLGGAVDAVALSPDGDRVAITLHPGTGSVFDTRTGAKLSHLGLDGSVDAMAFSPDGHRVAAASRSGSTQVFAAKTGVELHRVQLDGPVDPVDAVAVSPDGMKVAVGVIDGSVRVFDAQLDAVISRLDHDGPVYAVAFGPDGARVATASHDGTARVFHVETGAELSRLDHDGPVYAVAFGPDGHQVATASRDGSARVFHVETGAELSRLDPDGPVNTVALSPGASRVATASRDGSVRVSDTKTGAELIRLDHHGPVDAVAFSPDGRRVATVSRQSVRVFDTGTSTELAHLSCDGPVYAAAFNHDGRQVAIASGDGSTRVFHAETGEEMLFLEQDSAVYTVMFSADGTKLATGNSNSSARVFDLETGAELSRLDHDGPVHAVAFSPGGTQVATASYDGTGRVFRAETGAEISRLEHGRSVHAVAFSPDGRRVATAGPDGSARVFDAGTGAELSRLEHDGPVEKVTFSADGTQVITGSRNGSVRVWIVDPGQLIEQARGRLARNLTKLEWQRFFRREPYRKTRADLPEED